MNLSGRRAERLTGYFAKCLSISASTSGGKTAISCGTGTAWGALHRLGLQGDHTIAIFGQGPVGLSATQRPIEYGAPDAIEALIAQAIDALDAAQLERLRKVILDKYY